MVVFETATETRCNLGVDESTRERVEPREEKKEMKPLRIEDPRILKEIKWNDEM